MRKIYINTTNEKNEISEKDFNTLVKSNLISTDIGQSTTDIKKAQVLYQTPFGVGSKEVPYIELKENIALKLNEGL